MATIAGESFDITLNRKIFFFYEMTEILAANTPQQK
jgi:hypothetical protein